ncbi:hypothetical protein [Fictibacillus nanhaiensis]|uniref:hypothetical protein n=1 Tax=Fictibacillus nanhaiensis TaxID=742169 RepID=UPI003C1BF23E
MTWFFSCGEDCTGKSYAIIGGESWSSGGGEHVTGGSEHISGENSHFTGEHVTKIKTRTVKSVSKMVHKFH